MAALQPLHVAALALVLVVCFPDGVAGGKKSMVDVDTAAEFRTTVRRQDGNVLTLSMSDEFTEDGRTFSKGEDSVFEAANKPDDTNQAIQYYNASSKYVRTEDGALVIETRAEPTMWEQWDADTYQVTQHMKPYTSGMVQSWNKFCFTGGVLELSVQLPGTWDSAGVWPAAWLMGNLARAGYQTSTMHMWPWSYDQCRMPQDTYLPDKQEINACDADPGFGMRPGHGRGAPEIDIFEVMPGHDMPGQGFLDGIASTSLQVAPGISDQTSLTRGETKDKKHRPQNGFKLNDSTVWYDDLRCGDGDNELNWGFWGMLCGPETDTTKEQRFKYQQDAVSLNTKLRETHFEAQHVYRIEWQPGPGTGYINWYLDDNFLFGIDDSSLGQRTGTTIPFEPMYLILNVAMSHQWGFPEPCDVAHCGACYSNYDCKDPASWCALPKGLHDCANLPSKMKIDYLRLYQDSADESHTLGCSPPKYPTAEFIQRHPKRYADWEAPQPTALGRVMYYVLNPAGRAVSSLTLVAVVLLGLLGRRWCPDHRGGEVDVDEAPWELESREQAHWSEARESTSLL